MNLHESQRRCIFFDPPNPRIKSILPETNSSPLKMDGWKTSFLLGWPICRGELLILGMAYAFLYRGWRCKPPVFRRRWNSSKLSSKASSRRWDGWIHLSPQRKQTKVSAYIYLHLGYDMTFFGQRSQDHQRCLYNNSLLINSVSSTGKDSTKQHGSALLADEDPRQGPGWAECYPTWDLSGPSWLLIRGDRFGWCSVGGRCWGFGRMIGQVIL